jgi:hypothetical protein
MCGLVLAVLMEGFLFMVAAGLQWSSKLPEVSGGGNTELDNGQPVKSWRHDRGREKEMAERRHDVVRSWH